MVGLASNLAARQALQNGTDQVRMVDRGGESDDEEADDGWSGAATLAENRTIRAKKLKALSSEELSLETLRSLFRLLDDDGSGEVSADEIKRGLMLLGFPEANDPVALSRVVGEIDDDNTGTITEGEFLAFFGDQTRTTLGKLLKEYVLDHTYILATKYGHAQNKDFFRQEVVPSLEIKSWIAKNFNGDHSDYNLWLDVVGYDEKTYKAMGEAFEIDAETLSNALLFRWPEISKLESGTGTMAVVHHLSLSDQPLKTGTIPLRQRLPRPISWLMDLLLGPDPVQVPMYLHGKSMKPKDAVSKIAISLEQSSIITFGRRLVVTFRVPVCHMSREEMARVLADMAAQAPQHAPGDITESIGDASARTRRQPIFTSKVEPIQSPFASDDSGLRRIFEDVRRRMEERTPDVEHLYTRSAKGLAVVLLDSIMSGNYTIRDTLLDWEEILEATIRGQFSSQLTAHLDCLSGLTHAFERVLKPLATALHPKTWEETTDEGEELESSSRRGSVVDGRSTTLTPRGRRMSSTTRQFDPTDDHDNSKPRARWETERYSIAGALNPLTGLHDSSSLIPQELTSQGGSGCHFRRFNRIKTYLCVETGEYFELAMNVETMVASMQEKRGRMDDLRKVLSDVKADMMNKTLYALTLITAVSTPVTICSGIFGMNFVDMSELDPETGPGYILFWYILGSVFVLISYAFIRLRLLEALK